MQKNAYTVVNKLNTRRQTGIQVKHAWLEIMLNPEFNPSSGEDLDKDKLFDELNQDCWELFDDMIEWQNNAIRYSFPTD